MPLSFIRFSLRRWLYINIDVGRKYKVTNINFKNKTFETVNGETFPLLFDVNEPITLEEFQELVDKSENAIKEVLT